MHRLVAHLLAFALAVLAVCPASAQSTATTPTPSTAPTIYGLLDVATGRFQEPGQNRVLGFEGGALSLSFLGIRGSDDLGGGLRARFGLETYVQVNQGASGRTPADPFWGRTLYVGLQGTFGVSVLGRLPTPLYTTTRMFNPFDESYGFSPSIRQWYEGTILGDARWSNSLGYASPEPEGSGFSWQIQYNANDGLPGSTGKNVGASLLYRSGPLLAAGAYQRVENGIAVVPAGFDHQTAFQLGISYDLRYLRLYGQAGGVKTSATTGVRTQLYQLGGAAPVGLGLVLVSYGYARAEISAMPDVLRRTFSLGYDYFLSKSTDLYALAMNERITNLSSANSIAAGLRLRF